MPRIDSDAHVVETPATWEYMDKSDQRYKPVLVTQEGWTRGLWIVEGESRGFARPTVTGRAFEALEERDHRKMAVPKAAQDMENVGVRLRHMDELGIDIQVLYPTAFIHELTEKPEVDVSLCNGYNRWMADIWKQGGGRLRWLAQLPLLSIPDALDMLPYCREHGAVGINMRPIEGLGRLLHDPYFDPIYDAATRYDMCIGVHVGSGLQSYSRVVRQRVTWGAGFWGAAVPGVGACHAVISTGLPERFPKLRIGFIEAAAQWVPWVIKDIRRRGEGQRLPENLFEAYRLYVSCYSSTDDIDYIAKYTGDQALLTGTDYGHNDMSVELDAIVSLGTHGNVSPELAKKILDDNPRRFYGL